MLITICVTLLAGVWIETIAYTKIKNDVKVTLLAGVWIETSYIFNRILIFLVTLLAGVWIETICACCKAFAVSSHAPCGRVD